MQYTELQLDALRELANIGSGTAGTALSAMLGQPVDINVPRAAALPLAEAVDSVGAADELVSGVVLPIFGDFDAVVVLLFGDETSETICRMLGVPVGGEDAQSALSEIGNILGSSYINALGQIAMLELEPEPPQFAVDMLASIVSSVLIARDSNANTALLLDSQLEIEGESCTLSFLLVPTAEGVKLLLDRLGVGA
jgi:chemotaxis protein CheC